MFSKKFQQKNSLKSNEEEEVEQPMKWDIEMEEENDEIDEKEKNNFQSFYSRNDTDNYIKNLKSKKTFTLTRQLTITSKKKKINRSKTAITLHSSASNEKVDVIDEDGKIFKLSKNLLSRIESNMRNSGKDKEKFS